MSKNQRNKHGFAPANAVDATSTETKTEGAAENSAPRTDLNDASSNPEIIRDRLNALYAEVRAGAAAQAENLNALEAHLGDLCKQWDAKIAALEKSGHGASLRDAFAGIAGPVLVAMKSLQQLREITGHMADPALDKLIAEAKRG